MDEYGRQKRYPLRTPGVPLNGYDTHTGRGYPSTLAPQMARTPAPALLVPDPRAVPVPVPSHAYAHQPVAAAHYYAALGGAGTQYQTVRQQQAQLAQPGAHDGGVEAQRRHEQVKMMHQWRAQEQRSAQHAKHDSLHHHQAAHPHDHHERESERERERARLRQPTSSASLPRPSPPVAHAHPGVTLAAPRAFERSHSAADEAEAIELSQWSEKMHELQQQCELYHLHSAEADVWLSLHNEVKAARAEVHRSELLKQQMDSLLHRIDQSMSSEDVQKQNRLREAQQNLRRVQVQLEEGELANLSLTDYDQLISAVGQYQLDCAQLKAEGFTGSGGGHDGDGVRGDALVETLRGFKMSLSENELLMEEAAFMARLQQKQFFSIPSPNDGDCLYHSTYMSKMALEFLKVARTALGKPGMTERQLEQRLSALSPELIFSGVMDLRIHAMETIRTNGEIFRPLVLEALVTAASGLSRDMTSRLQREELLRRYPCELALGEDGSIAAAGEDIQSILKNKKDLLEVYTSVMGNPGVFGEKNEIIALSMALKRQVRYSTLVALLNFFCNVLACFTLTLNLTFFNFEMY
jgi:hypothetical protein